MMMPLGKAQTLHPNPGAIKLNDPDQDGGGCDLTEGCQGRVQL
jgi:hypothetical protein